MAPEKERVKNTPQNIRFFHPGSKTAENHIVPVSIPVCRCYLPASLLWTIEKQADNSGKQDSTADHQNSKTVR